MIVCSIKLCFGHKNWIDLICIVLVMSYSEYQCSIPRKSYIYALVSRISLSDIEMDYLRTRNNNLGVY